MHKTQTEPFTQTSRLAISLQRLLLALIPALLLMTGCQPQPQQKVADAPSYTEIYRPQFHFTPQKNWMNDPNGLVYLDGEYHLFYQYNPFGDKWGHMSWGHAVSADLLHWQHLPVALPEEDGIMIFSGSAVIDEHNTSGFGQNGKPAMVAIYTGYHPDNGLQTQNIAFSTDRGRSWTKYSGNPVIDIKSKEFRDPKVFWYEPGKRWIMVVALAADRKVCFYGSPDLKQWTALSEFGPAGAIGGVWECPDLFQLPVDGNSANTRWVLIVNMNPGGIAGGSGAQYFIGSFDGTGFHTESQVKPPAPPQGKLPVNFEGTSYGKWTVTGEAFGSGPIPIKPAAVAGIESSLISSAVNGNDAQGTLTSPAFRVSQNYINFLVGGGNNPGETAVNLLVNGAVVRSATGGVGDLLDWVSWDVREFAGQEAQIQIIDRKTGNGGYILVEQLMLSNAPASSSKDQARWVDYGKDFYAVTSWSNTPREDGQRLWIAWMNNWQYGQEIPTSPWRSAQTIPRAVALKTYKDGIRLTQMPVAGLQSLRGANYKLANQVVAGNDPLAGQGVSGKTLEIIATFQIDTASEFGLKVRKGAAEETVIGYNVRTAELFVDRSKSGKTDFNPQFPGSHHGPLPDEQGRIKLHLFVDWSSIEVFGNDGRTVITERIFPSPDSDGVALYAKGGAVKLISLDIWPLQSVWNPAQEAAARPGR